MDEEVLVKINNWLKIKWKFPYKIWEDLFVSIENEVTNIVYYDGEELKAKRKI